MKGHKAHHHKHRETGGANLAEEDLRDHPHRYNSSHVEDEAEERKHGGHVKHHRPRRKHGGHVHHEKMEHLKHAKHVGAVHGAAAKHHAGRKPRKSGGRTGADSHPFSSARHGSPAPGRKEEMEFE